MPKYWLWFFFLWGSAEAPAQTSGSEGSVRGVVRDGSGGPVAGALLNLVSTASRQALHIASNHEGGFVFSDLRPGSYTLHATLPGFEPQQVDVTVRSGSALDLNVTLRIAARQQSVTVSASAGNLPETNPGASHTLDQLRLATLPATSPDSALNDAIMLTTPGIAADSNGFFHPLGDHAQVSYVIDGQPVSDQRNKVFSTSLPANAIQSMEVIYGSPAAEYGDKTSLIINATTRSGLGQRRAGSFLADLGSFRTLGEQATLGWGSARWGNFLAVNTERTGRFLDTPEFRPVHAAGNTGTGFYRLDFQPGAHDALHLNLLFARNWFQVPNTYAQPQQDQRQKVVSFNVAPGYQHTFDARNFLTINAFFRRDRVDFYPSRNPLDDTPATISQQRSLTNIGVRADMTRTQGRHTLKTGLTASRTRLNEQFRLGITDPAYNAPCLSAGLPDAHPEPFDPSLCAAAGLQANEDFLPSLLPWDLSRGGHPYAFQGRATISQLALFAQDSMTWGPLTLNLGLRFDHYQGLTDGSVPQPRAAFSWLIKRTGTVVRGGYSHTLETPANENLVVSGSTGQGGLAGNVFGGSAEQRALPLGSRNQYDAGVQQRWGRWLSLDISYFRKYTRNAYDFDALFSTPVTFPIAWKQSKLDGISARIDTGELRGVRVQATMGHANARFFGPENGGIVFNSNLSVGAYRQDHDQVYQQNVNVHYQRPKSPWWADFTWRYDSGLVVGAVNNPDDALALTADQQAIIGFYCGEEKASLSHRISNCRASNYGAERIQILKAGEENADHNPPRTTSRHILNLAVGTDNLFHREHVRTLLRLTVVNLTGEAALYNFLSPFGGTHWVEPRKVQGQIGWAF